MATPSFRAADIWRSIQSAGNGPRTFTKPAGTADGDVLLWFAFWYGTASSTSWTVPSGFTEITRLEGDIFTFGMSVWRKEAGASEPSTYDFEGTAGNGVGYGYLAAYQDGNAGGSSLDAFADSGATIDSGDATANIVGVTTATANTRVVSFVTESGGSTRTFTAVGTLAEVTDCNASGYSAAVFDEVVASAGAISGRTATASGNGGFRSITIALKGVAASGPVITGPNYYYGMISGE